MTTAILLSIVSVFGLIFSLTNTELFQKIITTGLAISVFLIWTGDSNILLVSLLLQLCLAFLSTIYSVTVKGLKTIDRISIATLGLVLTVGTMSMILHYPGQGVLRFALLIPLILFVWTSIKHGREQPKEFGFMIIWTIIAATRLTAYLMN